MEAGTHLLAGDDKPTLLADGGVENYDASVDAVVEFYVAEHNGRIPHAAFQGQTADEVHFGSGEHVPDTLAVAKVDTRQARIAENRARRCVACK